MKHMTVLKYIVSIFLGYIFGSVSFSVMISEIFHKVDIRKRGSGNAGATNMARSFGLGAGLGTMFGDMLKTALALLGGYFILGTPGMCIAGAFCVVGHCWPVFYEFRGGKGISAGSIIALFISWKLLAVIAAVFLLGAFISKKVSLGSVLAAVTMIIAVFFITDLTSFRILAVFTATIVLFRHIPNIRRLIRGEEPDFSLPSKKKKKTGNM